MSHVIVLSGSPLFDSLDWSEECLSDELIPAFAGNQGLCTVAHLTDQLPVWRYLPLIAHDLSTGLTQVKAQEIWLENGICQPSEGISTPLLVGSLTATNGIPWTRRNLNTTASAPGSQLSTQYYEQSFAAHDELQSSQIIEVATSNCMSFSTTKTDSFDSYTSDAHSQKEIVDTRLHSGLVVNMTDIPGAAYLHSITPQTMTVNLVVGVISVSEPRRIIPRKGGQVVELVEMVVGDDTRAGFGMNIWIPPAQAQTSDGSRSHENIALREEVLQLRPRDVILARRMALSSFRGTVYAQSLRRGMTSLDLLYRTLADADDTRGAFKGKELDANSEGSETLDKVKRVKDWVAEFVGAEPAALKRVKDAKSDLKKGIRPSLPLDTP